MYVDDFGYEWIAISWLEAYHSDTTLNWGGLICGYCKYKGDLQAPEASRSRRIVNDETSDHVTSRSLVLRQLCPAMDLPV